MSFLPDALSFISSALAADPVTPVTAAATAVASTPVPPSEPVEGSLVMKFLPLVLILVVFYLLLIRPQQKKLKEQEGMLGSLKKGDKVITAGGIVGSIVRTEGDKYLIVEIAPNVDIKVVRSTVVSLADPGNVSKGVLANKNDKPHDKDKATDKPHAKAHDKPKD